MLAVGRHLLAVAWNWQAYVDRSMAVTLNLMASMYNWVAVAVGCRLLAVVWHLLEGRWHLLAVARIWLTSVGSSMAAAVNLTASAGSWMAVAGNCWQLTGI